MIRFYAVCVIAAFWFFGAGYFWVQYHDISTSALYVVAGLIVTAIAVYAKRQINQGQEAEKAPGGKKSRA
ncbi:hypothetical protein [Megasphaera hominis]|jgi:small neutral amino acid transporter SnatA (MarC family)|uniref:Uncharacterized protein n=1 Tax=Megasphaera hominis TaxID=159836 RepID=A0ABR6VIN1_9FIRM|nr:hypothetical protein [Megasphaera hominis]MBC3537013.1 hypothetical protein [Megasphaera hominis]